MGLPGRHLATHGLDVGDTPAQALAHHHVDLDLCHVEPAAVLGRVHELEAIPQRLGLLRREGLVQRGRAVRVEVVHHQRDALGLRVLRGNRLDEVRPVDLGPALGDLGHAPSGQWFASHEDVAYAQAPVLVVLALGPPWRRPDRLARLAYQLARRLVHADHRMRRVVGPPVHVEHPLHGRHELRAGFGRNHPRFSRIGGDGLKRAAV